MLTPLHAGLAPWDPPPPHALSTVPLQKLSHVCVSPALPLHINLAHLAGPSHSVGHTGSNLARSHIRLLQPSAPLSGPHCQPSSQKATVPAALSLEPSPPAGLQQTGHEGCGRGGSCMCWDSGCGGTKSWIWDLLCLGCWLDTPERCTEPCVCIRGRSGREVWVPQVGRVSGAPDTPTRRSWQGGHGGPGCQGRGRGTQSKHGGCWRPVRGPEHLSGKEASSRRFAPKT